MQNIKNRLILGVLIYAVATTINAADVPANLQNSVERIDPGLTSTDISNDQKQLGNAPPSNVTIVNGKKAPTIDSASANIKFKCTKIILLGNKIFSTAELSKLYQDKINKDISLADLEKIAQKITDYYRNAGYVLSQAIIPPQEIGKDGVVKIQIVEGYINKVSISGCKRDSVCSLLKDYGEHISRVSPLTLSNLERFSFLANDIPGVKVRAVLTRSSQYTGAADLTFIVDEKDYGGFLAYNNYNSTVLGRQQILANVHANNILSASETALNGIISRPTERMQYASFTHRQQLNSNGLGGRIAASYIKTDPDMETIGLGGLIIPGNAFIASANLEYTWIRSHAKNLYVGAGFKYLNSHTTFGGETLFKDNIRSANIFASYNFLQSANTYNMFILTYSQGINMLGAEGNPPSRIGESLDFSKFDIYVSTSHKFTRTKFSSVLACKAQYAFNTVPSSETFGYGGVPFGYGYEPAEFSGDRGVAGLVELQYPTFSIQRMKLTSQLFGFFDFGYVWDINKTVEPTVQSGASTGLGFRANTMRYINLDFIVATPLKPSTIEGTPNYVRFLFNVKLHV